MPVVCTMQKHFLLFLKNGLFLIYAIKIDTARPMPGLPVFVCISENEAQDKSGDRPKRPIVLNLAKGKQFNWSAIAQESRSRNNKTQTLTDHKHYSNRLPFLMLLL